MLQALITAPTVVNRQALYNRSTSSVFGNGSGNPTSAIDVSKQPLLAGQTAELANYTNYNRRLNGVIIDVENQTTTPRGLPRCADSRTVEEFPSLRVHASELFEGIECN